MLNGLPLFMIEDGPSFATDFGALSPNMDSQSKASFYWKQPVFRHICWRTKHGHKNVAHVFSMNLRQGHLISFLSFHITHNAQFGRKDMMNEVWKNNPVVYFAEGNDCERWFKSKVARGENHGNANRKGFLLCLWQKHISITDLML